MDLRRLRYFVALADRLNFTATAKFLGIAQPPLSVQIRNLETEVGGALFHRERRKIRLTALGILLLEEARALLQQADRVGERIRDAAAGRAGEIRIAYTRGAFSEKITRRIRKFLRKNRGVRFEAFLQGYDKIYNHSPEIDAVITEAPSLFPEAILLEKASAQIAVPPKHRLAEYAEVTLSDLIGESLILPPSQYRSPLEKILSKAIDTEGIKLNFIEGPLQFSERIWQVSLGCGVIVCSSSDRDLFDAVQIPFVRPEELFIQCLPTPDSRAVALAPFLEAIRE